MTTPFEYFLLVCAALQLIGCHYLRRGQRGDESARKSANIVFSALLICCISYLFIPDLMRPGAGPFLIWMLYTGSVGWLIDSKWIR